MADRTLRVQRSAIYRCAKGLRKINLERKLARCKINFSLKSGRSTIQARLIMTFFRNAPHNARFNILIFLKELNTNKNQRIHLISTSTFAFSQTRSAVSTEAPRIRAVARQALSPRDNPCFRVNVRKCPAS